MKTQVTINNSLKHRTNQLRFILSLFFCSLSLVATANTSCDHLQGCEAKACHIKANIKMAQDKNNSQQERGLKIALQQVHENCSDESLRNEILDDITEIKGEISEYKQDLKEAMADGKADKVNKYQAKIKAEEMKLKASQAELDGLK